MIVIFSMVFVVDLIVCVIGLFFFFVIKILILKKIVKKMIGSILVVVRVWIGFEGMMFKRWLIMFLVLEVWFNLFLMDLMFDVFILE